MADPRLTVAEALAAVLAAVRPSPPQVVPLAAARGLVLAEAPRAPVAVPPRANAGMDGYAVRAADVRGARPDAPAVLPVAAAVAAGADAPPLPPGAAMRVFTGAPVPEGADSVIRQEDTDRGSARVAIRDDRDAGSHVRPAGADVAAGTAPVAAGSRLTPPRLGALAAIGSEAVAVFPPPRVAIVTTGTELAGPGEAERVRTGGRLGDSNAATLAAAVEGLGARALVCGPARDTPDHLAGVLAEALRAADVLVTSGGVSVGDHDLVRPALAALGATERFHRLRLRPGGPTVFGTLPDGRPWFGLPGNPVSTLVTFTLFVAPAIRRMMGDPEPAPPTGRAVLAEAVTPDPVLALYLRVRLTGRGREAPSATLTGAQGSQLLTSLAVADALAVIPPGTQPLPAGHEVATLALPW